ncbi:GMC family oxidoreductase [Bradyrhizobium sp. 187]|uniref:GMC family oxidoreductase n=1 Tax=Bradyrhizobium sp. 187 TaxID=2782655 RepID=UPI001FFED46A|nr:GMC family oxidoreductase [Bradyrhizobium sp. 187]UPJ71836.1 GMC family oxidoreductase [Bradyrhizobium sp. 187]
MDHSDGIADILIVGGGTAGCVLASRLSEDASRSVVLVEAGPDIFPSDDFDDVADAFPRAYANADYFWEELKAVSTAGSAPKSYHQARLMGGGSSVMGMVSLRGLKGDFDRWSAHGARGWTYNDVLPFFQKLEQGPYPLQTLPYDQWPGFNRAIADGAAALGLALKNDANIEHGDGVYPLPLANNGVSRISAASAYLTATIRARRNLRILARTEALSIQFRGQRAIGVTVRVNSDIRLITARQIIVSAGSIGSPVLLQRSGIGDGGLLQNCGIEVQQHLPDVGRHLKNHLFCHMGALLSGSYRQSSDVRQYCLSGIRASSGLVGAPASDIFIGVIARIGWRNMGNRVGLLSTALYAPFSSGTVQLSKRNPGGAPDVNFNLLSDDRDRVRLVSGARIAESLMLDSVARGASFDAFILPANLPMRLMNASGLKAAAATVAVAGAAALRRPTTPLLRAILGQRRMLGRHDNERDFSDIVLASALPQFHPTGTCAIGRVVDSETRVFGVEGLRVIDASIMPEIPRANTNLPTLMIAEKCASHIARARAALD